MLGKLAAMPDADGIIYDKGQNLVLAVSGDGGKLMTFKPDIDPVNGKIDPPIDLGGAPEFLAADGEGKVYINLEDKDLVAVVDLKTRKVIARWPVAPGGHPVGMALDRKTHRLFIGCRNPQKMIVMSTEDGKVVADLPIGAGVDATKMDARPGLRKLPRWLSHSGRREGWESTRSCRSSKLRRERAPWTSTRAPRPSISQPPNSSRQRREPHRRNVQR